MDHNQILNLRPWGLNKKDESMNRTEVSSLLGENLECNTLLVVGEKPSVLHKHYRDDVPTYEQNEDKHSSFCLGI
jgi:hypothetical protein